MTSHGVRFSDLEAALRELTDGAGWGSDGWCSRCADTIDRPQDHEPDCPYAKAQALIQRIDNAAIEATKCPATD